MPEQSGGEKILPPSPRKLGKAREDGKIAKSQDLNSATSLLAALFALYLLGPSMFRGLLLSTRYYFSQLSSLPYELDNPRWIMLTALGQIARFMLPFMLALIVGGVAMNFLQVGFLLSFKVLKPKFEKINPFTGFKKFFSMRSLVELAKSLMKLTLVGAVAYMTMRARWPELLSWSLLTPLGTAEKMGALVGLLWFRVILVMLVIGLLDYGYQKWQYLKELRMTIQEAKEETKEVEGDPRIKQRIRQVQRQMAMQRMMAAVPEAEVVITNPTTYAVAIRYDMEKMDVPVVIAKGARIRAEKIRRIAIEHDVPIVRKPELARALYRDIEVGQPVPEDLFASIAEVLAFVYEIDQRSGKIRERQNVMRGLNAARAV